MKFYIDDGIGDDWFFISVPVNDTEAISFDHTLKGHRILKQKLVSQNQPLPKGKEITMEWDTLFIGDGKLLKKEHAQWVDLGQQDWVSGEVWETVWEKPITEDLKNKLLKYSNTIRENSNNLAAISQAVNEFEKLLVGALKL